MIGTRFSSKISAPSRNAVSHAAAARAVKAAAHRHGYRRRWLHQCTGRPGWAGKLSVLPSSRTAAGFCTSWTQVDAAKTSPAGGGTPQAGSPFSRCGNSRRRCVEPVHGLLHQGRSQLNTPFDLGREFVETRRAEPARGRLYGCRQLRGNREVEPGVKRDDLAYDAEIPVELINLAAQSASRPVSNKASDASSEARNRSIAASTSADFVISRRLAAIVNRAAVRLDK